MQPLAIISNSDAFDLVELDGKDLRREPIEERKRLLAKLLRGSHLSIVLNETREAEKDWGR
jgi:ATP-dependent DNA ligase